MNLYPLDDELLRSRSSSKRQKIKEQKRSTLESVTETKYYEQRYSLFSKYDRGIQLDDESWYSVTPEKIALHHAERCRTRVILDVCCGVGGNSIAFASTCEKVVAVDIDPLKIAMGKHNAAIYSRSNIEWVEGDFVTLAASGALDKFGITGVFISPPWGGPTYSRKDQFPLKDLAIDLHHFVALARRLARNIAIFLPRNLDCQELRTLAPGYPFCEVESNYLNDRLKAVTCYFGDWVHAGGGTEA